MNSKNKIANVTIGLSALIAAIIILTTFMSVFVSATVDVPYNLFSATYDAAGNLITSTTPVNNVNVIGFVCANSGCTNVSSALWSGQTLSTGNTNHITLTYPTQLQSQFGYAVFYYKDGYIAWSQNPNWSGNGAVSTPSSKYLTQANDCRAPIDTFSVINDVYPNEPIMVDISASMDATTRNEFSYSNIIGYVPAVIAQQSRLQVLVTLDIMNSAGQIVSTQSQTVSLAPSGSQRVQFDYTPTIVDRYTARVSTNVTDNKCLSTDIQFSQKNFNVIPQSPTNMCYTLLNNLSVLPINQITGHPVTIDFDKISNYYDGNGNLFVLPTTATINVQQNGQTVWAQQLALPANANTIDAQHASVQFTPANSGYYTATVTAKVPVCPFNNNTADSVSEQFVIIGNNLTHNSAPQFTQLPDVYLFYNQGLVNNLFNVNNYATDADSDAITFAIAGQSNSSVVNCALAQNGAFSCTTGLNQVGCSTVTIQASDGKNTSSASLQACIIAPNRAPIFNQLPNATLPFVNGSYQYSVSLPLYAFDPDGQVLTFTVVTQTNQRVANCVVSAGNNLVCNGVSTEIGFSDIRVVASDGLLTASSAFRLTVNPNGINTGLNLSGIPDVTLAANSGLNQNIITLSQYTSNPQNRALAYIVLGETNTAAVDCSLTISNTVNCNVKPNIYNQFSDVTIAVSDGITRSADTFRVTVGNATIVSGNNCTGPDSSTIVDGNSKNYYLTSIVPFGSTCTGETRSCSNGTLSGSFQYPSCVVGPNGFNNTAPVWLTMPQLNILRNAASGSLDLAPLAYDPDVPPQTLKFYIDSQMTNLHNQSVVSSCVMSHNSILTCYPNHGQDGRVRLYVDVTDGINVTQTPVDVMVGINLVPSRPQSTSTQLIITQFNIPDFTSDEFGADIPVINVAMKSDGHRLKDVIVTATVLELGIVAQQGPFDLGAQTHNVQLRLPVDSPIAPGVYTLRLSISDTESGNERVEYRDLFVFPSN